MKTIPAALFVLLSGAFVATLSAQNAAPTQSAGPAATPAPGTTPPAPRRGGGGGPTAPRDRPADGPALFTEDFESGKLNSAVWSALHVGGDATIKVQSDRVAHGKYALQIHYPAGTVGSKTWNFAGIPLPAALHDHFYGRAYVYLSGVPMSAHNVLMLAGSTGFPISNFLEIGLNRGQFQPSFQLNGPTGTQKRSEVVKHEGAVPVDRWFCLEWELTDKPEDRIVVWVDGKVTVNQTFTQNGIKSELTKGFAEMDFGFRNWANAAANAKDIDIYFDDIAFGDKPIGQLAPVPAEVKPVASVTP
jgi:hypothetical protein